MVFWLLAIAITIIVCAALYYAASGRMVNATTAGDADPVNTHFRLQLHEIEADIGAGRLLPAEAVAAKAELARELLRQQREAGAKSTRPQTREAVIVPVSIALVVVIAFVAYAFLGNPGLPSQPFAARPQAATANLSLDAALKTIEARLATSPDDLQGWTVIAPVYMRTGRYADAERAFRRILALSPPTADSDTDLAEALMLQNGGQADGEAATLLNSAAALDPSHVRSRFYLVGEAMRIKDFAAAVSQWSAIIALGKGDEPWMTTAKTGLADAEAGRDGKPLPEVATAGADDATQSAAIRGMVDGLATRLAKDGGPLADWTKLVRSEIVLGDIGAAQKAYDAAKKAYPDAGDRAELDGIAAQAGLKLDGGAQ
jgi:cytochrome c-type biogenesis protein CcmH